MRPLRGSGSAGGSGGGGIGGGGAAGNGAAGGGAQVPGAQRQTGAKAPSGLMAVLKKELARFFTDRRSVLTTVIMPGAMIFLIYFFMGTALNDMLTVSDDYKPNISVVNPPASLDALAKSAGLEYKTVAEGEVPGIKEAITAKTADLLVVYPKGFDESLDASLKAGAGAAGAASATGAAGIGGAGSTTGAAGIGGQGSPLEVQIYFNSTRTESSSAYSTVATLLSAYRDSQFTLFTINASGDEFNLASEEDQAGFMLSSIMPMIIIIFLFSGCMSVAPESIAGEKERGTIATLLVTPLKRWELALGKIISLSLISLLAALSSFIGIMLSLPNMMGASSGSVNVGLFYSAADYLMLLAIIVTTVLFFVGVCSLLSTFAKTVKEAGTYNTPLMIAVMLVAILGSFQGAQSNLMLYLVPSYNSAMCIGRIFSFTADPVQILLTCLSNLFFTAVCLVTLTKLFSNEKIIFAR
jgi:sodium transport system permease protein